MQNYRQMINTRTVSTASWIISFPVRFQKVLCISGEVAPVMSANTKLKFPVEDRVITATSGSDSHCYGL